MFVGVYGVGLVIDKLSTKPVIHLAVVGMNVLLVILVPHGTAHTGYLYAVDMHFGMVWNVDIKADIILTLMLQHIRGNHPHIRSHVGKISVGSKVQYRESHRWNIMQSTFDSCAHSAGVELVDT